MILQQSNVFISLSFIVYRLSFIVYRIFRPPSREAIFGMCICTRYISGISFDIANKCTRVIRSRFPFPISRYNISNRETAQLRRTSRASFAFKCAAHVFLTDQNGADRAYRWYKSRLEWSRGKRYPRKSELCFVMWEKREKCHWSARVYFKKLICAIRR